MSILATVDSRRAADGAPSKVGRARVMLAALIVLAALPCVALLCAELSLLDGHLGLPLDDGFIHLQFARSLAHGDGLAYNPGERVPGSTAPLWTALLSLAFLLHLPPLAWAQSIGVLAQVATVVGTYRLAREHLLSRPFALLAGALAAWSGPLVWGALSGMEVPLFTALACWGMALVARRDAAPLPGFALLGMSVLARPEGALLLLLAVGDASLRLERQGEVLRVKAPSWPMLAIAAAVALLAVAPTLLAYRILGSSPLPTTFGTKAGYSSPGLPTLHYLHEVAGILVAAAPVAVLLAPAGIVTLLARAGGARDRGLLPATWLLALPLAYGVLSGRGRGIFGNFGRYFYPLLPVVAVLAALALAALRDALPPQLALGRARLPWPRWAMALVLLGNLPPLFGAGERYLHNVRDVELGDVRLARALAPRLPPQATLAVDDIGAVKYLLPNHIVDLAGIVTPAVHAYARDAYARTGSYCPGLLAFVRAARPDYLAGFPRREACFDPAEFPPLLRLEIPDNITLGESTLLLRATPWTRYPLRAPASRAAR